MEKYRNKMLYLAAVLMYCAGAFQFASGNMLLGAVYVGSGACFTATAAIYSKNEREDHL